MIIRFLYKLKEGESYDIGTKFRRMKETTQWLRLRLHHDMTKRTKQKNNGRK